MCVRVRVVAVVGVPKPPGFSAPPLPIGHAPQPSPSMHDTPSSGHAPFSPAFPCGARPSPRPRPLPSFSPHPPHPLPLWVPPPSGRLGPEGGGGGGAIRAGSRTSFGNRPWRLTRPGPGAWPPGSASGFALGGGLACLEPQHQLKWPCDTGRRPPLFHFVSIHLGLAVWHPPLQATQFRLRVPDEIRSGGGSRLPQFLYPWPQVSCPCRHHCHVWL